MDIVYVLIGFVCGFLCDASIHYLAWKRAKRAEKSNALYEMRLKHMSLKEVEDMCKKVSRDIINEKKREMRNESNKV